jgi:toluene monooxygenase electron transfer component
MQYSLELARSHINIREFQFKTDRPAEFGKELVEELPGFCKTIHFHPVVSGASEVDDGWDGRRGLVHEIAYGLFADRLSSCEIYFAGPPMMATAIQKMLVNLAGPAEQVRFDQFY